MAYKYPCNNWPMSLHNGMSAYFEHLLTYLTLIYIHVHVFWTHQRIQLAAILAVATCMHHCMYQSDSSNIYSCENWSINK